MPENAAANFGVSYFGNRYPDHARADLRAMVESGADFVVHVMSEADARWNPGTMTELAALSREAGLRPWLTPWGLGGVFGGESASYAVGEHPESCQVASDGRRLPALCPRQPVFRTLIRDWLDVAATTGVEIVQWDELHLALPYRGVTERWACRCEACQEAFQARFGASMPGQVTAEVTAFLDDLMTETLGWMAAEARERGMDSAIVLLADTGYDPALWRGAATLPGVKYFGTTAFWLYYGIPEREMAAYLSTWAERTLAATADSAAEPMGWVQAFNVPAGREEEIGQAISILANIGVSTIVVWSWRACIAMSGLAADDPVAAWSAVERGFSRLESAHQGRD